MVYCGKPSRGCQACRKRKSRCDAKPNGCTQCKNAGRICPGYRSLVDVVFRDQSQSVIKKLRDQKTKGLAKKKDVFPKPVWSDDNALQIYDQGSTLNTFGLVPSLEERAKCYFLYNFGGGTIFRSLDRFLFGHVQGFSEANLYKNIDTTLNASLQATSLACYANYARSLELTKASRRQYVEAIRLTNEALACHTDAIKDNTLLSVTLLGLYETLSGECRRSMEDWASHVKGAAALIKLRGKEQFHTSVGRRTFIQVSSDLLTCCLQWSLRLPDHVVEMTKCLVNEREIGSTICELRLFQAMLEFNQFRYNARNNIILYPQNVIGYALQLDQIFVEFSGILSNKCHINVLMNKDLNADLVYKQHYHVYSQPWMASLWNYIRVFRILTHQQICQALLASTTASPTTLTLSENTFQLQQSMDICLKMSEDILASVPVQLYLRVESAVFVGNQNIEISRKESEIVFEDPNIVSGVLKPQHPITNAPCGGSVDNQNEQLHTIATSILKTSSSGFVLIRPLWIAGLVQSATKDIRHYCAKTLRNIGLGMGIKHALLLADILESHAGSVTWNENK